MAHTTHGAAPTDPEFGPLESWLAHAGRSARITFAGRLWTVQLRREPTSQFDTADALGYGTGATLAEACAAALNDVMGRA